ncbi:MAG: tyrosine-type recombinase/integrase [Bacteroidales bacterium]|nr:tyrosine-type recombinase/integrase [Bacteroidales bacterium]
MIDLVQAELEIKKYLKIRYSNEKTIELYAKRFMDLLRYYPATEPIEITESELNLYIKILINRKDSRSLIVQFIQVAEFYFNHIYKKSYVLYRKNIPKAIEKEIDTLDQEEIFLMIENFTNMKHQIVFILVYSCCLELSELLNVRVSDINSKKFPYFIQIRNSTGEIVRKAPISQRIIEYLKGYWKYCKIKPEEYLLEGAKVGTKYGKTSAEKVIKKAFEDNGLSSESVIKVLKRTYMQHMVDLGIPIILILESLGIQHFDTIKKYTKALHGHIKIDFTPLDKLIGKPKINEPEIEDLEKLIFTLKSKDEQEYLLEAILCFRSGALKAGIVFSWSAFIRILQNRCVEKGYKAINVASEKMKFPKKFSKITDFETIKETNLLKLAFELKVISKHQKSQMDNNLDLRNHCGHPSIYKPEINKAKAFIEDIVSLIKNEP